LSLFEDVFVAAGWGEVFSSESWEERTSE